MTDTCSVCGNPFDNDEQIKCRKCGTSDPNRYHGRTSTTPVSVPTSQNLPPDVIVGTCPHCGAPLKTGETACEYCRASLIPIRTPEPEPEPEPEDSSYTYPSYEEDSGHSFGFGAKEVVGLIIGLMMVAILFPMAMTQITINSGLSTTMSNGTVVPIANTAWSNSVTVVFAVLLPILVIIGIAIRYF